MTTTEPPVAPPPQLSGWDLSELLPDAEGEGIERALADVESRTTAFAKKRESLSENIGGPALFEILGEYEALLEAVYRVSGYGSLWFSSDTQSDAALAYRNRVQQVMTGVQNRTLFFSLWWQEQSKETAERLFGEIDAIEGASDHAFFLRDLRRLEPYKLDEAREQIVNLKDADGIGAVLTLYSMMTNAFEYHLELDGEASGPLTRDGLMAYVHSDNPEHRATAYQELYRVYGENSKVLAQMYTNRVRDWHNENVELRGHRSPIAVRNVSNDIPDEAVQALLERARANAPLFQRYFRLKAGWLGKEKLGGSDVLRRYDIYAPLATSDRRIDYADAVATVLDTFDRFDSDVGQHARRVFRENHIDSEPRPGKRGGAFCATISPALTPWVLVNYTGRLRDVATLAHEMGHAIHSMLAEDHSILTQHPCLPLAETASVFAEILMTDKLLAEQDDPLAKRELLATAVDDMYATVMRQAFFVMFEEEAHALIMEGSTAEELHELYMANLERQFADSVELAPEFRYEWLSIPHIYSTPFYCYAYSFGQLLVLALYRRYQEEGEAFKPGYIELLATGGSQRPEEVLQRAGVDVRSSDFWQGGFDVIAEMIAELEELST